MKRLLAFAVVACACLGFTSGSDGQDRKVTSKDTDVFHLLWPNDPNQPGVNLAPGAKGADYTDYPGVYIHRPAKPNGTCVVICPGGGYGGHAMDHEGRQIGVWLNAHGITGVILKYRLGSKYNHPIPLGDAQRAMRYVRSKATDLKIDPKRVGVLGFSAGGHLASTVGTHFDTGDKNAKDPIDRESSRPDFLVLMYPVITLTGPHAHVGSRNNLLGKNPDAKLVDSLCNDKMVTKDTPPTFLVHTSEDKAVPPENSVLFYLALRKSGVPAEMHIYEKGRHGLGLALKDGDRDLTYASWPDRCIAWMKGRGF